MRYRVVHTTRYEYSETVTLGHNEAHLRPRRLARQTCSEHRLAIDPMPAVTAERLDVFDNPVLYFALQEPHGTLEVVASSEVELRAQALPAELSASAPWDGSRARLLADTSPQAIEARGLVFESALVALGPDLAEYAAPSFPRGRPLLEAVHDFSRRIFRELVYEPNFTTVATPVREVLAQRRGVCQDFAHLAVACLRSLGLPARYVSGYIESRPPAGAEAMRGADASHAWLAVYDPDWGWIDFDPTNDQIVGERHVTLAWGRDYADVTPLKGVVFGGGAHRLDVGVEMTRLEEHR